MSGATYTNGIYTAECQLNAYPVCDVFPPLPEKKVHKVPNCTYDTKKDEAATFSCTVSTPKQMKNALNDLYGWVQIKKH